MHVDLGQGTYTIDTLVASQLKMITEEMARLKSELYSEHGGLGEIQRQLETLKSNPLMRLAFARWIFRVAFVSLVVLRTSQGLCL